MDNGLVESFFATLQTELLDHGRLATRSELATAIFEYVEPSTTRTGATRRWGYLSPNDHEHQHAAVPDQKTAA